MSNKLITAITLTCAAMFAFAGDDAFEDDGGDLRVLPKGHKSFIFVDAQTNDLARPLNAVVGNITSFMDFDLRCQKGVAPDLRAVPAALKAIGADGAIWFVEDAALPIAISAVEDGWGVLNVAPLKANADKKKFDHRVICALSRLFASMFDVGDSLMMPGCVMRPASGVSGLDKLTCAEYSPEAAGKIKSGLAAAGYKFAHVGTYLDACEGGWAPAPTNDIQRAIWNKVHAMPTSPIKINPGDKPKSSRK